MCNFLSAFIHRKADKLPLSKRYKFGDLRSHSETAELCKIKYGADGDDWAEWEWTGDKEHDLTVRDCRDDVLKAILLADFPTRADAFNYGLANIPQSVTTLDLSGATLPKGIKFPESVTTLYLSRATLPKGIKFPESVTTLYLYGATLPKGTQIPAKCKVYR